MKSWPAAGMAQPVVCVCKQGDRAVTAVGGGGNSVGSITVMGTRLISNGPTKIIHQRKVKNIVQQPGPTGHLWVSISSRTCVGILTSETTENHVLLSQGCIDLSSFLPNRCLFLKISGDVLLCSQFSQHFAALTAGKPLLIIIILLHLSTMDTEN